MAAVARAALCLCLCLFASEVRGSHVSSDMNRTIQNLLQHYRISARERFNGKPVFPKELPTGKDEMKMVFMGGVLETYEKLLGHMLTQLPAAGTPPPSASAAPAAGEGDVGRQLHYIRNKIHELKRHRYAEPEKLLLRLQALRHIQMDDRVVQSKALWELPRLYEEASLLSNSSMSERRRRRRRRQTRSRASVVG